MAVGHTHEDEHGILVKCYHSTRNILKDYAFWIGVTVSFPIEHFIWTKLPGFSYIAEHLGLIGGH